MAKSQREKHRILCRPAAEECATEPGATGTCGREAAAWPPSLPRVVWPRARLHGRVEVVARRLLGAVLVHAPLGGPLVAGRIVEVEAYGQADPASHSVRGQTKRNASMFGEAGLAYVYLSYGLHWCCNVVVGPAGRGEAVLLRALEPLVGHGRMRERRGDSQARLGDAQLCRGPGNLTKAMGIDRAHDGMDLLGGGALGLFAGPPVRAQQIVRSPRVGIRLATERLWRVSEANNACVSRPPPWPKQ